MFNELILHYPEDSLDKFEEISYLMKNKDKIQREEFLQLSEKRNYKDAHAHMADWIEKAPTLFEVVILLMFRLKSQKLLVKEKKLLQLINHQFVIFLI
jgi:hypothetical protein